MTMCRSLACCKDIFIHSFIQTMCLACLPCAKWFPKIKQPSIDLTKLPAFMELIDRELESLLCSELSRNGVATLLLRKIKETQVGLIPGNEVLTVFQRCSLNRLTLSLCHHLRKQHSSCPKGPNYTPTQTCASSSSSFYLERFFQVYLLVEMYC